MKSQKYGHHSCDHPSRVCIVHKTKKSIPDGPSATQSFFGMSSGGLTEHPIVADSAWGRAGENECIAGKVYVNPLFVPTDGSATDFVPKDRSATDSNVEVNGARMGISSRMILISFGVLYILGMLLLCLFMVDKDRYWGMRFDTFFVFGVIALLQLGIVNFVREESGQSHLIRSRSFLISFIVALVILYVLIVFEQTISQSALQYVTNTPPPSGECIVVRPNDNYYMTCLKESATRKAPFAVKMNTHLTGNFTLKEIDKIVKDISILAGFGNDQVAEENNVCHTQSPISNTYRSLKFVYQTLCHVFVQPCDNTCTPYSVCSEVFCDMIFKGHKKNPCKFDRESGDFYSITNVVKRALDDPNGATLQTIFASLDIEKELELNVIRVLRYVLKITEIQDMESCMLHPEFAPRDSECYDTHRNSFQSKRNRQFGNCSGAAQTPRSASNPPLDPDGSQQFPFHLAIAGILLTTLTLLSMQTMARHMNARSDLAAQPSAIRQRLDAKMKTSAKTKIHRTAFISCLVGFCLFFHGQRQEQFFRESNRRNNFTQLPYIALFYCLAMVGFYSSFVQFTTAWKGLQIVRERSSLETKSRVVQWFSRAQGIYNYFFSVRKGIWFIPKAILWEFIEIVVQIQSLDSLSPEANTLYIGLGFSLLSLNLIFSPLLFLCRHKIVNSQYAIVTLDSTLDLLFLFNNLFRGGEQIQNVEENFFVNMALIYPSISILLRTRSMSRAIMFKDSTKNTDIDKSIKEFTHSVAQNIVSRRIGKAPRQRFKECERGVYILTMISGLCFLSLGMGRFIQKSSECSSELTPELWSHAEPKRMFPNGIFAPPECGYGKIKTIVAEKMGITTIPRVIGKCTHLRTLRISKNQITQLPCELFSLVHLRDARIDNNPVAKVLNVSHCSFPNASFPPKFICEFMSSNLEVVYAEHSDTQTINTCIGKFLLLQHLSVRHNDIQSTGISKTILTLKKLKYIDIRNNRVAHNLSFRSQNVKDEDARGLVRILNTSFSSSLIDLDLSQNFIAGGHLLVQILDLCPNLKTLNISSNEVKILIDDDLNNWNPKAYLGRWPSLHWIDISSNPIQKITPSIAGYFQHRSNDGCKVLLHGNMVTFVNWYRSNFTQFPTAVLDQLDKLQTVILHDNIHLSVPANLTYFCRFTQLRYFDVSNFESGETVVPPCFRYVYVIVIHSSKHANFSWPYEIFSKSPHLISLRFSNSELLGQRWKYIPSFDPVNVVEELKLDAMGLSGLLPVDFDTRMLRLKVLSARRNQLFSRIPTWNFTRLNLLDLTDNRLFGNIPASIMSIKEVYLNRNANLTGTLPPVFNRKTQCLDIRGTNVSGAIPAAYFQMTGEMLLPIEGFTEQTILRSRPFTSGMDCARCTHNKDEKAFDKCDDLPITSTSNHAKVRVLYNLVHEKFEQYFWCYTSKYDECRLVQL